MYVSYVMVVGFGDIARFSNSSAPISDEINERQKQLNAMDSKCITFMLGIYLHKDPAAGHENVI